MEDTETDDGVTTLEGPIEDIDGKLTMRIPLEFGGKELIGCSRGIAQVVGSELHVVIPPWLAEKLGIAVGMTVVVDNRDGKFNIYPEYGEEN